MAPDAHPREDGDPVAGFHSRLRDLHLAAGKPSARVLEKKTGYGSTTCNDVLRGARFPSWEVTEALVAVLGGDELDWRPRWQDARRALDARQATTGAAGRTVAAAPAPEGEPASAPAGGAATGSPAGPPAHRGRWRRTVALASVLGAAILTVVALVVVLPAVTGGPSRPPATPTCPMVRRYTVEVQGRLLDAGGHVIGEIVPGDVVDADHLDTGPYRSRRKVTVVRSGKAGYVDPAKLRFVATICRTRT
jgi:hypothetical protein